MTEELVGVERTGHVAIATMNRRTKLNAMSYELHDRLEEVLLELDRDTDVRCIVLTGAGGNFCVGDDVKQSWSGERYDQLMAELGSVHPRPESNGSRLAVELRTPMVAAVDGYCWGMGLEAALWADVVIASKHASFNAMFIKHGVIAGTHTFFALPRLVGPQRAALLLLTGDTIDASTAAEIGLVAEVVPGDTSIERAVEIASAIACNAPLALAHTKEALRRSTGATPGGIDELYVFVSNSHATLFATQDHLEASTAYFEKRDPTFTGS